MNVLFYCQHLSGTGHFVRSYEICRALAERHDVWLTDGGRHVPRPALPPRMRLLPLERLARTERGVVALAPDKAADEAWTLRRAALAAAVEAIRPDAVLIEGFPFSKWDLHDEVLALLESLRFLRPNAPVWCSRRDVIPPARVDRVPADIASAAPGVLAEWFDGVLVHGDPALATIEMHTPWARDLPVRVEYTGMVCERVEGPPPPLPGGASDGCVLVSGGGAGDGRLQAVAERAWPRAREHPVLAGASMIVSAPPFSASAVESTAHADRVIRTPFDAAFAGWMRRAALSVSHAGYNTCTTVLASGVRAVLAPRSNMSDQVARAALLAERGLVQVVPEDDLNEHTLARAIRHALDAPPTAGHGLNLDGASVTARLLERGP